MYNTKIEDLKQSEELKTALNNFSNNPSGFFILSGLNGTGKTHAAMAVYNRVTPYRLPQFDSKWALFATQADLNIRWSNLSSEGRSLILDEMCESKLIILDDVGTRTPTDAFMDFLYALIDKRYTLRENRGTIITTNLDEAQMAHRFGSAFASRIGSGQVFRLDGQDRRHQ